MSGMGVIERRDLLAGHSDLVREPARRTQTQMEHLVRALPPNVPAVLEWAAENFWNTPGVPPNQPPVFMWWRELYDFAPTFWRITKYARYFALWLAFNYSGWWPEDSPPSHTASFALRVMFDLYVEKASIMHSDEWPMPEKCEHNFFLWLHVKITFQHS